jgi:hypothetical protein
LAQEELETAQAAGQTYLDTMMAPEKFTPDSFFAELEQLGEDEVRARVASGIYSSISPKKGLAEDWLLRKRQSREAEAERRRDASNSEQMCIARSAKNAAWTAATAAIIAAICAVVAIVIALQ